MRRLSADEDGLIRVAVAHLRQLSGVVVYDVDEATLRVASSSLRTLLVEDMLARAWKAAVGGPMTFKTWGIKAITGDNAVAFCGGGQVLPGIPYSAAFNAELVPISLDLAALCRQTRIQVGQAKISTVEVIQYVANTLGGAHFDPEGKNVRSRKPVFDRLRTLEAGAFGGVSIRVNDRSPIHHEVLSIAEAVLASPEVRRLTAWTPG